MIDAQMKCKLFYKEKFMIIIVRPVLQVARRPASFAPECALATNGDVRNTPPTLPPCCSHRTATLVFLPSVYDALLLIRPACNFRDGIFIKNYVRDILDLQKAYLHELPFNDAYGVGLIHLCCANYRSRYQAETSSRMSREWSDINLRDIILGFAPVFLFIKSYRSCLVAELSQLCYKGVFRTIALGFTDALCTFSCTFSLSFQGVIVPVGRIGLGRILNVLGSSIDPYMELSL